MLCVSAGLNGETGSPGGPQPCRALTNAPRRGAAGWPSGLLRGTPGGLALPVTEDTATASPHRAAGVSQEWLQPWLLASGWGLSQWSPSGTC